MAGALTPATPLIVASGALVVQQAGIEPAIARPIRPRHIWRCDTDPGCDAPTRPLPETRAPRLSLDTGAQGLLYRVALRDASIARRQLQQQRLQGCAHGLNAVVRVARVRPAPDAGRIRLALTGEPLQCDGVLLVLRAAHRHPGRISAATSRSTNGPSHETKARPVPSC